MYSKESIDSFMMEAFNNNINNVFVQVRSRGDALYKSDIVKMNSNVQNNFDPLSYVILLGDLLDIQVHAWINTYLIWSANSPPRDSTHIYYSNPDWFESDYFGKSDIDIKLENIQTPSWEGLFLSPNHSEVNSYVLKLIKEIFKNYPKLDGIHFDYIRFQDDFYGFNEKGINDFKDKYNFNPKDIFRDIFSSRYGWSNSEVDSIKNIRIDYNCNSITSLINSVQSYRDSLNLNIMTSAAVKSNPIEARERWFQDWIHWVNEDMIDFVIPMNYSSDNNIFFQRINAISDNILNYEEKVIMGISMYNQDESSITDKILLSTLSGYNQICFFSYNSLKQRNINFKLIKNDYNQRKYLLGE
tara:strand:+ start:979 stop:2049 length:1071 start_codon:yes stop_codon:yes gene_type:complete